LAQAVPGPTARLRLREVRARDLERVLAWWNDPQVRQAHGLPPDPLPMRAVEEWYRDPQARWVWILEEREGGAPVGLVEVTSLPDPQAYELGIVLDPGWWGQGLGPEAVEAVCRWILGGGHARRLEMWVRADNGRALRAFRRAGFRPVEEEVAVPGRVHLVYPPDPGGAKGEERL
jgi:RimJ/RimL family protein N-acetyltransferase